MEIFFLASLFVLGTCIGSFLNALNYRVVEDKSLLTRSACPRCGHTLSPLELIPLVSFLIQKGRCRACKKPISFRYPLVEAAVGIGFLAVGYFVISSLDKFGYLSTDLVYLAAYTSFLLVLVASFIGIAAADFSWGIIPDLIVFPAVGLAAIFRIFDVIYQNTRFYFVLKNDTGLGPYLLKSGYFGSLLREDLYQLGYAFLLGAAIAGFFYLLIYFTKGKAMGQGDVKYGFLIGLGLAWPAGATALVLAFLTGALGSVMLILVRRRRFGDAVPFGPFLSAGALVSLFAGQQILDFYLSLFK